MKKLKEKKRKIEQMKRERDGQNEKERGVEKRKSERKKVKRGGIIESVRMSKESEIIKKEKTEKE